MEATVLKIRLGPFAIAAGIEKVAILQAATNKNDFIQNETLIAEILVLIDFYSASHLLPNRL